MKKYTFLNFLYKKEITEGFLTNIALAGALASGTAGEIEDLNPQQLKNTQEQIKDKYKISDGDSKIFAALKEKGMKDYYIKYLISFYKTNDISLNEINVSKNDIDFYRVLKSGSVIGPIHLDIMKKEKPMTKEEEGVLYGLANDWGEYLEINAFGIHQSMQNKEIYLSNDLLKIIVFNEKYKLDHKIGFGQLSDFLEKHKITWGDIDGMRKVMKNYYDVLENYKKRPM
jgi:hypothetical protein